MMTTAPSAPVPNLPAQIEQLLLRLVEEARQSFQEDLRAMFLFGSGAEGRLRATSDLNLLLILRRFERAQVDRFREPLRLAQVAARASAMFVLEAELPVAAEAFAVKFDDLARRRRLLCGEDLIAALVTSREARKLRVRQVLLNVTLRLRERYAATSLRDEQLAIVVADVAGPLRAAAATLGELEGRRALAPREALESLAESLAGMESGQALEALREARRARGLPPGRAAEVIFQLMNLAEALRLRGETLK